MGFNSINKNDKIDEAYKKYLKEAKKVDKKKLRKILLDARKAVSLVISKVPMTQSEREGILKDAWNFMGEKITYIQGMEMDEEEKSKKKR